LGRLCVQAPIIGPQEPPTTYLVDLLHADDLGGGVEGADAGGHRAALESAELVVHLQVGADTRGEPRETLRLVQVDRLPQHDRPCHVQRLGAHAADPARGAATTTATCCGILAGAVATTCPKLSATLDAVPAFTDEVIIGDSQPWLAATRASARKAFSPILPLPLLHRILEIGYCLPKLPLSAASLATRGITHRGLAGLLRTTASLPFDPEHRCPWRSPALPKRSRSSHPHCKRSNPSQ